MSTAREHRPPLNLSELESKEPEHERGELGFGGMDRGSRSGKGPQDGGKKSNWGQILVSTVIAVIVSFLILFQYAPSKTYLNSKVEGLTGTVGGLSTALGGETQRIDSIINAQGTYAKKSELEEYAKATDLGNYIQTVDLDAKGYATTTDLDTLKGTVEDYVDVSVNATEGKIDVAVNATGLSYSLSGSGTSYMLKITSNKSGTFIGRITLSGDSYILETTLEDSLKTFYGEVGIDRTYIPRIVWDEDEDKWILEGMERLTIPQSLEAKKAKTISVPIEGYTFPNAFVEVFPSGTGGVEEEGEG